MTSNEKIAILSVRKAHLEQNPVVNKNLIHKVARQIRHLEEKKEV